MQAATASQAAVLDAAAALALPAGAAKAALVLLLGGLAMIFLITLLVLLQNLAPLRSGFTLLGAPAGGRELRPVQGAAAPRHLPARRGRHGELPGLLAPPVDQALDGLVELGAGEPRLMRALPRMTRLRLYGCRGCRDQAGADPSQGGEATGQRDARRDHPDGCAFETQAVADLFHKVFPTQVVVRETLCRLQGAQHCEFEVRH